MENLNYEERVNKVATQMAKEYFKDDWEVTPINKKRMYTESEVIVLLNWMQDIHCRYTQKWMFGDVSSVEVLEQYNNQKQ